MRRAVLGSGLEQIHLTKGGVWEGIPKVFGRELDTPEETQNLRGTQTVSPSQSSWLHAWLFQGFLLASPAPPMPAHSLATTSWPKHNPDLTGAEWEPPPRSPRTVSARG